MTIRTHVVLAASLAAVLGVSEGLMATDVELSLPVRVVVGLGLLAACGALFGCAQGLVWRGLGVLARRLDLDAWWARATSPSGPREPVVGLHAAALGVLWGAGTFALGAWVLLPQLLNVEDAGFARGFGVVVFTLVLTSALAVGAVVATASRRPLTWIDARLGLPWPRRASMRWTLWLAAPLCLALVPYLTRHADELGVFAIPFWLFVFIAVEGVVWLAWREGPHARLSRWSHLPWIVLAALGAAFVASISVSRSSPTAAAWTQEGGTVGLSGDILRGLGDLDRDGYSIWLGGGDCAPLDRAVNPGAVDVADNGIDENCDGVDFAAFDSAELATLSGALRPDQVRRYNVVLVVVDAIRADHTGIGGYERATTPYIDAVAEESLVFTRAYSQSPATMLSVPSLLTGRDPSVMKWRKGARIEPAQEEVTLTRILSAAGFHTAIMAVAYFEDVLSRLSNEYDHIHYAEKHDDPATRAFVGRAAANVLESVRYIERRVDQQQPFFLTLYIPDPHHTYRRHGFGISAFGDGSVARYDGEIANSDRQIGLLITYLKHRGIWDDTIFVITSDHGEEFKEHGGTKHARTCYVESTHVPLVVHVPGVQPSVIDRPVGLVDVAPTIVELLGLTDAAEPMTGQSLLVPAMTPERAPKDRAIPCATISQRAKAGNFFRRAMRTADKLLVHEVLDGQFELYDTARDPKEQTNVYDEHADDPEVVRLRNELNATLTGNLPQNLLTN